MADFTPRIRDQHRERQERLEYSADQARAALAQRRNVLDDVNTIAAYAQDMSSVPARRVSLTERRTFIESFVKEVDRHARQRPRCATPSPFLNRHNKLSYSWAVDLKSSGRKWS